MASTYSALKLELMATGEKSGTWGDINNTNLGTALEEAIAETAAVAFTDGHETVALTDSNATQVARHLRLNLTGDASAGYDLIVPTIEKPYIINNATDGTITVKTTAGTGIAVPTLTTMWLYADGTNVVDVVSHLSNLTLANALPIASGGTAGTTAATGASGLGLGTGDSPQFTAVNVGHATDSTIARVSAGRLSIEGDEIVTEDVINVFTVPQTAKTIADTDGSFDLNATTHVTWIPAAADELTFTNITVGRSGTILLKNPSAYTITINATTVESPADAATELSVAGSYVISYVVPNGETTVFIEISRVLT